MTRDATAAAPAGGDGGIPGRSLSRVPRSDALRNDFGVDLDAVLVGYVIGDEPAARDVDETWCATPRWADAMRALLTHRSRAGRLGNFIIAGDVLARSALGVYLPLSTAAEAVLSAREAAWPPWTVARARERRVRLQLRRVARFLDDFANAELSAFPAAVETACRHLDQVRHELARVLP